MAFDSGEPVEYFDMKLLCNNLEHQSSKLLLWTEHRILNQSISELISDLSLSIALNWLCKGLRHWWKINYIDYKMRPFEQQFVYTARFHSDFLQRQMFWAIFKWFWNGISYAAAYIAIHKRYIRLSFAFMCMSECVVKSP